MSSTPESNVAFENIESASTDGSAVNSQPGQLPGAVNSPPANSPAPNNLPANPPAANPPAANPPAANNFLEENSQAASQLTNANNNSQASNNSSAFTEVDDEPSTTSTSTSTSTSTTTLPPSTTTLAPVEEVAAVVSNTAKTKKRRSTKQREADAGQKEMLELIREVYRKEFAEIPEKFRPKPKAYVARAAWYKKEGPERDKYIESWVLADKDAANARMGVNVGKKRLAERNSYSNEYILDTLPSIVSEATNSAEKFKPSTDTLRERAKKAVQKMNEITDRAHDQLMKRIKQPVVRRTANYLFKETRKLTKRLTAEINTQTRHLQKAAKDYIRRESLAAKGSLEKKANANLTAALGRRPAKRMTHRLTRLRNAGKGTSVKNFLNGENKHGRIPKTLKAKWKTGIPENATPLNAYND